MDLNYLLHLITKYTAMTNKEILQASILDIIFENRNKDYGAYALRKGYNARMLTALGAGMSVIFLLVVTSMMNRNYVSSVPVKTDKKELVIRAIEMPKEKVKEPEQPKEVVRQKPVTPKVAEVKFTTPPKIVAIVKDPVAAVEELNGKTISTQNIAGVPDANIVKEVIQPVENGTGTGPSYPKENDFVIQERDPEFPGGADAMKKFLARYLTTPEKLEAGEKKVVKIRFKVDKDGSVNTFEIVTSGGNDFDNEVVRVCKKMPKWTPAIQNGINVPVSYILPVTFIGVEE